MALGLRSIFLTRRFFALGWGLVLLFVLGWAWDPVLVAAKLGALAFAFALLAELFLLYSPRSGLRGARRTYDRWSNGDANPVTIELESGYGIGMRLRVLDELPHQFQKRDLAFTGVIDPWAKREFSYQVRPVERGVYRYGAINAMVSSVLGLMERRFVLDADKEVAVYPSYLQLRKYELLAISNRLTLAGVKRIRRVAHQSEFERIK
ncbi:MAG TPA: DUF58 domain-containing protein, partial [Flavobacteriales bacterium]|nr:DUF58 domain-containing protein [Flavobacteriales bacterium]